MRSACRAGNAPNAPAQCWNWSGWGIVRITTLSGCRKSEIARSLLAGDTRRARRRWFICWWCAVYSFPRWLLLPPSTSKYCY
ncbi:MAG: hypothetical protein WAV66_21835 [Anaerolineae bacterium]